MRTPLQDKAIGGVEQGITMDLWIAIWITRAVEDQQVR